MKIYNSKNFRVLTLGPDLVAIEFPGDGVYSPEGTPVGNHFSLEGFATSVVKAEAEVVKGKIPEAFYKKAADLYLRHAGSNKPSPTPKSRKTKTPKKVDETLQTLQDALSHRFVVSSREDNPFQVKRNRDGGYEVSVPVTHNGKHATGKCVFFKGENGAYGFKPVDTGIRGKVRAKIAFKVVTDAIMNYEYDTRSASDL